MVAIARLIQYDATRKRGRAARAEPAPLVAYSRSAWAKQASVSMPVTLPLWTINARLDRRGRVPELL
jgi:hypothetical protein